MYIAVVDIFLLSPKGNPSCSVTKNYFENLMRALENGLSDVDAYDGSSRSACSKNLGGGSKGARGGRGRAASSKQGGSSSSVRVALDTSNYWSCEHCTYANAKNATACEMCHHER